MIEVQVALVCYDVTGIRSAQKAYGSAAVSMILAGSGRALAARMA